MTSEFFSSAAFCYGIAFVAVFLATAGQILLKRSADDTWARRVFGGIHQPAGGGLLRTALLSMFCNQIALRQVP